MKSMQISSSNSSKLQCGSSITPIFEELPDHVALHCLARLPLRMRARASCVSKAWLSALLPTSILPLRLALNIPSEARIFISIKHDHTCSTKCIILDAQYSKLTVIPNPYSIDWHTVQAVSLNGKLYLLAPNAFSSETNPAGITIVFYDEGNGLWSSLPASSSTAVYRKCFGCVGLGKFIYVAGGFGPEGESLATAQRFDTETNVWETLPNMRRERDTCSAFVMDGKMYVIGGYKTLMHEEEDMDESSGEFFDPESREWTLVSHMWPESLRWRAGPENRRHPVVAMVGNRLYAMEHFTSHLFAYDANTNRWSYLDCLGNYRGCNYSRLVSAGEEVWGICAGSNSGGEISFLVRRASDDRIEKAGCLRRIDISTVGLQGLNSVMLVCATLLNSSI